MTDLIYLKLGGSLITDKRQAETPRLDVLDRLAQEIRSARAARPDLRLVIGHGSGSFGHVVGRKYGTRQGVDSAQGWYGFAATGDAAARLNRLVAGALLAAGLPAWSIQPGACLRARDGRLCAESATALAGTLSAALERGVIPVVFGDVVLDDVRGGTIASTEEIFEALLAHLPAGHMVLAGEVDGVFTADPQLDAAARPIPTITPADLAGLADQLGSSHGVDVTGGMVAKVAQSVALVQGHPGLAITLCSGLLPGQVHRALTQPHLPLGTRIHAGSAANPPQETPNHGT
jgi:isopentenyl phosphate kinase